MKRIVLATALSLSVAPAMAWTYTNNNSPTTNNVNHNDVYQSQTTTASSTSTATNAGNTQSTTFENVRQAPAFAMSASGPCVGAAATLSTPIGGFGGAVVDDECQIREAARLAASLGDASLARSLLYSLKAVKAIGKKVSDPVIFYPAE